MTGSNAAPSWAKLRQVVIATTEHDSDLTAVRKAFGLGAGFADPELHELHMDDATMPVSGERYLEFVAPTGPEAAVHRWITRIGGRGGYVLSVQHPDPDAVKARALAAGVRVPIDTEALGHRIIQLHPQDVGLLLELDGIADPQAWFWDDINPGPEPDATVSDIVGVEVPVADPAATAAQWHSLLDLGEPGSEPVVDLGGCWVRFVEGGPSAEWTVHLRRADTPAGAAAQAPELPGLRFVLV
ncbi:MAG: hypothetical protein GC157_16860 [Frankiales bacterium]|nr:hypothetical protein [Frankiales bacterium]